MKDIVKAYDKLPWIVKLILCLPVLDIAWAIYRIIKGAATKNVLMLVVGILWIIFGCVITWLVDLICTIIWKRPIVIA
jgi:hypothetical protein